MVAYPVALHELAYRSSRFSLLEMQMLRITEDLESLNSIRCCTRTTHHRSVTMILQK